MASTMATKLYQGKEHASYYQKFRFDPCPEIIDLVFSYVDERLPKPRGFAVGVGCGTGQNTRILSSYFQKVLGVDVSRAQIEEAQKATMYPNITYSVCPAEELPVADASVDLLAASTAVHWFDIPEFLKEVDRVLKPGGCLAFYNYLLSPEVHYKDISEQMTKVYMEVQDMLDNHDHERVCHVWDKLKKIFEAVPYTDKKRIENMTAKVQIPLTRVMGYLQSFHSFQTFLRAEPENAMEMIQTAEQRFLKLMGTSSSETEVEFWLPIAIVLASKPE